MKSQNPSLIELFVLIGNFLFCLDLFTKSESESELKFWNPRISDSFYHSF